MNERMENKAGETELGPRRAVTGLSLLELLLALSVFSAIFLGGFSFIFTSARFGDERMIQENLKRQLNYVFRQIDNSIRNGVRFLLSDPAPGSYAVTVRQSDGSSTAYQYDLAGQTLNEIRKDSDGAQLWNKVISQRVLLPPLAIADLNGNGTFEQEERNRIWSNCLVENVTDPACLGRDFSLFKSMTIVSCQGCDVVPISGPPEGDCASCPYYNPFSKIGNKILQVTFSAAGVSRSGKRMTDPGRTKSIYLQMDEF